MTAYEKVFNTFRSKVSDYDLMLLEADDESAVLLGYMKSAIAKFGRLCDKLATADDGLMQFEGNLDDTEIDILTELMLESWTKPKLYDSEKLRNSLSTKDYSFYSPANLLVQLRAVNKDAQKNARHMMNEYSILNSEFSSIGTRRK